MESDGEEADDEFDQITMNADVDDHGRSHLSIPNRVCFSLYPRIDFQKIKN